MAFFLRVTVMVLAVIGLTKAGCPPLWTRYRNNCYRFMGQEMSWTDAENHCRQFFSMSGQGHLASVHSSDEADFLIQYVESSLVSSYSNWIWIGLSKQPDGSTFSWSDGTVLDYDGWQPEQPDDARSNEDCGEIRYLGSLVPGWNDHFCSNLQPHVCKMPTDVKGCF
ncbi:alpha-N-acetylgalactosamine-specific lectin-like [Asterias amurensis]|uniref:alpha-N-acetylgalactosamine-specific lectin-like n=1 Tax=Asterias amurensis TaxID=7602 RepID=UPI003AB58B7D